MQHSDSVVLTFAAVGCRNCGLQTIHCNFSSFWKLVEKFHNWKISVKPSLHRSVTFHCTCLLLLSLYNCYCISWRFSQRNTGSVHTFLKQYPVVQELRKDKQHLYVYIHHRCQHCCGSCVHKQGGFLKTQGCSVGFVNPHLGESFSVWHALPLHSRATGTCWQPCADHGPVVKGKVRPRSELFVCFEGLWFEVFCLQAGLLSVCNSNTALCHT